MTLAELQTLAAGEVVLWDSPAAGGPPLVCEVVEVRSHRVRLHCDDGTDVELYFAHCRSLRDTRFDNLRRVAVPQRLAPAA